MNQPIFKSIMIVDDDKDILSQSEKIFAKIGIPKFKAFANADQALKEIETNPAGFELIIVDVRMPVFSGIALVQYLKTHENKNIREAFCIPLVGSIGREDKAILTEFSFMETVSKPIIEKGFIEKLTELSTQLKDPESDKNFQTQFYNALIEKQYKQAELFIIPRIKKEPSSLRFLTMYAELLLKADQAPKAEEFLNKVLQIDPLHIAALNLLSKVYIKNNRFDDAMKVLEKARAYSPHNIDRLLVLGELHLGSGEADRAEDNFKSVLKLNPNDDRAAYGLGRALATLGRVEESKRVFANIKKGVELASFFNNKGILLVKSGKYTEGISLYKNALKIIEDKEKDYLLLYNIALAYSKLSDYTNALDYAKKSAEKAPKNYNKPSLLISRLEKESKTKANQPTQVEQTQNTNSKPEKYLLTGEQMSFIKQGFEDPPAKAAKPASADEEFITFGN